MAKHIEVGMFSDNVWVLLSVSLSWPAYVIMVGDQLLLRLGFNDLENWSADTSDKLNEQRRKARNMNKEFKDSPTKMSKMI